MYFLRHETGRIYDGEQSLHIMIRDNEHWDDRFLKHDITFWDASRKIVGCINFETSEDLRDFFEVYEGKERQGEYVLRQYDAGEYITGGHPELDQIRYYCARY